MGRRPFGLWSDNRAAVAPTVALSLFALIAAGGIAFDYARVASLDTELQNAADQAALAAATQLDQQANAIERATAAAQSLLANKTLQANDGNAANMSITITSVVFYATKANAEADNPTDPSACPTTGAVTASATARFVCVRTMNRVANYALTPVVAAFKSGNISAMAVAGLGQSICKAPPVMICNPLESTDSNFTTANYIGKGLKLISVGNGNGSWAPGNFGYLDTTGTDNGATGLRQALGWVNPPGECAEYDGVDTKPGASVSVTDAINTRFDIYDSNSACEAGGSCPASINTIKDVVHPADLTDNNACKMHNKGWHEVAGSTTYMPDDADALTPITYTPAAMGHPRDMCHAAIDTALNFCSGTVGTGKWDRDAYFRVNYGWDNATWKSNTGLTDDPTLSNLATRYKVYQWEIANRGNNIGGKVILGPDPPAATGNNIKFGQPVCSAGKGYGTGVVPGGTNPDRRRLSVAVVNCSTADGGLPVNGNSEGVTVLKWIEIFLVEPSLSRKTEERQVSGNTVNARSPTGTGDVYAEVIGETVAGAGASAGQVVRRDVPYLIK